MTNIVVATRTYSNQLDECKRSFEKIVPKIGVNKYNIERFYIIADVQTRDDERQEPINKNIPLDILFDLNPTRATSFNLVLEILRNDKDAEQKHLLVFSKEVELRPQDIDEMLKVIESEPEKMIVVGFKLKDNVLSEKERSDYSKDEQGNLGVAYQVPWNTCALWNKRFVYGKEDQKLTFDEICDKNDFGQFCVLVGKEYEKTDYKGMEEGLAIAELKSKDKSLEYQLIKKELPWNIEESRKKTHKIKMARKNTVLKKFFKKKN